MGKLKDYYLQDLSWLEECEWPEDDPSLWLDDYCYQSSNSSYDETPEQEGK